MFKIVWGFVLTVTCFYFAISNPDEYAWVAQTSNTNETLTSVNFIDNTTGWIVGEDGTILLTLDGGGTWESQASNTNTDLHAVAFSDVKFVWAAGDDGTILHSTDGGQKWDQQESGTTDDLYGMAFLPGGTGWVVGDNGTILHTDNNGLNWNTQTGNTGEDLYSVSFVDVQTGWAVGDDGTIIHTSDGGNTWEIQSEDEDYTLYAVDFTDADNGWAVGEEGTILLTTDGGENWNESGHHLAADLDGVSFIDDQTGWIVGEHGTILHSTDGGETWFIQPVITTEWLHDVAFTVDGYGWAIGTNGTVLHYPAVDEIEVPFASGSGTENDPYQIATVEELDAVRYYTNAHYIQVADLDLSVVDNWLPIGDEYHPFSGVFDGNDHTISNLVVEREDDSDIGLFGRSEWGYFESVTLENVILSGNINVGALVGNFREGSQVIGSSVEEGEVYGNERVGGLIGQSIHSNPKILQSYAEVYVEANRMVGGLVGWQRHTELHDSYAAGEVQGGDDAGGLVGYHVQSEIVRSFSEGIVTGGEYIGGLTGQNRIAAVISQSYSTANVSGELHFGGLSGRHFDSGIVGAPEAHEVFAAGEVTGDNSTGGLIGEVVGNSVVTEGYWDTESTGQTDGVGTGSVDGAYGLTFNEMTGSDAEVNMQGFDFAETWVTTDTYPRLVWEDDATSVTHEPAVVDEYQLSQNYPNPFNPSTTIRFALPESGRVQLTVYDILGRKLETLVDGYKDAGYYEAVFEAGHLSSGVYLYQIRAGDFVETKRLMLVK